MNVQELGRARIRAIRSDPILVNSTLMFGTTLLMAAGGAVFWVVAARLHPPETVGLAGSLVSTADTLALFAQLGLNVALIRTLPTSRRQAADVVTGMSMVAAAGAVLALGYCLLLPLLAPRLAHVLGAPWAVALFCVLVSANSLNQLLGSIFLGISRVSSYFRLNGVLLLVAKVSLPFLVLAGGALGLYGAAGGATLLCSVLSLLVILRHVPGKRSLRPSPELLEARRFAGAAYVCYVLHVVPQMVLPVLVINGVGPASGAVFFVSFQIVTLQNAIILAVANSTYAEAEKARIGRHDLVRRGGVTMGAYSLAGIAVVLAGAPLLLHVFGSHYAHNATTLRVLSLGVLATTFNYWSALRLRMSRNLAAMVLVQLLSTIVMLGLAVLAAPHGTAWVAAAWGVGHLVGGVVGYLVTCTVAPFADGDDASVGSGAESGPASDAESGPAPDAPPVAAVEAP